eukprot:gene5944-11995_t
MSLNLFLIHLFCLWSSSQALPQLDNRIQNRLRQRLVTIIPIQTWKIAAILALSNFAFSLPSHSLNSLEGSYEFHTTRSYILDTKNSLNDISNSITSDTTANSIYTDIDFTIRNTRLKEKLRQLEYETSSENRQCINTAANKVLDNINIIFEYFSISNDAKSKLMISDSYPGQKVEFLREGLNAVKSDLQRVLFCPH